jgi:hypothetical protein
MSNVNTPSIEDIRAQAKAAVATKLAAAKEAAEIALLTNDKFLDAQVNQALRDQTTEKLTSLIDQCAGIVESNPVINRTLRQERKFNPSKRYGLGNQFALLSGLLSGIQYSVQEHASLMLEITGLSPDLIETTLQYLGQLPYFSANYDEIVAGTEGNAAQLLQNVLLIESILGVTLDKSLIKQSVLDRQHEIALAKAEKAQAESELAATVEHFIIK